MPSTAKKSTPDWSVNIVLNLEAKDISEDQRINEFKPALTDSRPIALTPME
jgi:hypothetical protein